MVQNDPLCPPPLIFWPVFFYKLTQTLKPSILYQPPACGRCFLLDCVQLALCNDLMQCCQMKQGCHLNQDCQIMLWASHLSCCCWWCCHQAGHQCRLCWTRVRGLVWTSPGAGCQVLWTHSGLLEVGTWKGWEDCPGVWLRVLLWRFSRVGFCQCVGFLDWPGSSSVRRFLTGLCEVVSDPCKSHWNKISNHV